MTTHNAEATWFGTLHKGSGIMKPGSADFGSDFTFTSRFENVAFSNPEEFLGAALTGCYSMYLSALLGELGYTSNRIHTTAEVSLEMISNEPTITAISLNSQAEVPVIDEITFLAQARAAKKFCPVSKALAGVQIELTANLVR